MCIPGRGTESITSVPHPQGLGAEGIPGVISKGRLTAVRPASRLTHLRPSPFQAGPACSRVGGTHRRLPVRLGSPSPRKQSPQLPGAGPQQCPVPTPSSPQLSGPARENCSGCQCPPPSHPSAYPCSSAGRRSAGEPRWRPSLPAMGADRFRGLEAEVWVRVSALSLTLAGPWTKRPHFLCKALATMNSTYVFAGQDSIVLGGQEGLIFLLALSVVI